jgi:hypothetical protein
VKVKLALGVVVMFAVQCVFGVASEMSSSTPIFIAISTLGCFVAPACGGFVAKQSFVIPAAVILLLDWLLIAYAFSHLIKPPIGHSAFLAFAWPYIVGSLALGMAGAKIGGRLAISRIAGNSSPAT